MLKVGLTVSASIPVAVISITLFRLASKLGVQDATILENNIVQTAGSAGESIAFGVGVTMPAIMILGFDLEISRVMLVAVLGGLLGILMMIPLRRALIVTQHGTLKYPEGTACAEVLKAGASAESRAAASRGGAGRGGVARRQPALRRTPSSPGSGSGFVYKTAMAALKGWKDVPGEGVRAPVRGRLASRPRSRPSCSASATSSARASPPIMCAGGVLAYLVLIPLIKFFGETRSRGRSRPARSPSATWARRRSGAPTCSTSAPGAVAAGGIVSLRPVAAAHRPRPARGAARRGRVAAAPAPRRRTERDLPMRLVLGGIVALVAAIWLARRRST